MKTVITIFISLFALSTFAQTVLLDGENHYENFGDFGPNRKHYINAYFDIGYFADNPENSNSSVQLGLGTSNFALGVRYKRRLAQPYSIGFDLSYNFTDFKINPSSGITWQRYSFSGAELEFFNRFNFGRRGNFLGTFLDIGAYGNSFFSTRFISQTSDIPENSNYNFSSKYKAVNKNLDNIEPLQYGVKARIGFNRWVVSAKYRLSDIYDNDDAGWFPRLMVGVQVGLHK